MFPRFVDDFDNQFFDVYYLVFCQCHFIWSHPCNPNNESPSLLEILPGTNDGPRKLDKLDLSFWIKKKVKRSQRLRRVSSCRRFESSICAMPLCFQKSPKTQFSGPGLVCRRVRLEPGSS